MFALKGTGRWSAIPGIVVVVVVVVDDVVYVVVVVVGHRYVST